MIWLKGLVVIWAFWTWVGEHGVPIESGWVAVATQEACEAARNMVKETALKSGARLALSRDCVSMTADEFIRKNKKKKI